MGCGERIGIVALVCGVGCGPRVPFPGEDEGLGSGPNPASTDTTTGARPGTSRGTTDRPGPGPGTWPATDGTTPHGTDSLPPDIPGPAGTTGACQSWALADCGFAESSTADVFVESPLGSFVAHHALFASFAGCAGCVGVPNVDRIVLVENPEDFPDAGDPERGLVLELDVFEGPVDTDMTGHLTVYDGEGVFDGFSVTYTLFSMPVSGDLAEPFSPATAVTVRGAFWMPENPEVWGTFSAVYCPHLNTYAICE